MGGEEFVGEKGGEYFDSHLGSDFEGELEGLVAEGDEEIVVDDAGVGEIIFHRIRIIL